jgi:hypothetical protein
MAARRATHVVVSATPIGHDPQYPRVEILMGSGRKWTFLLGRLAPKAGWAHPVRSVHLVHAPYEPRNQATLVYGGEYRVAKAAAAKELWIVERRSSTPSPDDTTEASLRFQEIADTVAWAARDNARATEGLPRGSDGWLFHRAVYDSIKSITQSLQSTAEFADYDAPRPLTAAEAEKVGKIAMSDEGINLTDPKIRAFMTSKTDVLPSPDETTVKENTMRSERLKGNTMRDEQDNSWGRGYHPLPARLSGLGRFMDGLAPTKLLDHKVWPDDPTEGGDIHMLTVEATDVSIGFRDLESLIENGLIRIQSNEPGAVSFYFVGKSERDPGGSGWAPVRRRR